MNQPSPQGLEPDTGYLTDLSPRDKPWDVHKRESGQVRNLYQGTLYDAYAGRICHCSGELSFCWGKHPKTGERRLKLKTCRFCRVRHCPICQWRRSLMWVARFLKALPAISDDYPKARWIFITLTVRNCELTDLKTTIGEMNQAWKRLTLRKQFPLIGFAKALEITKGKDGSAHPHFHILGMVKPSYFSHGYLSQDDWQQMWREAMRISYDPIIDVRAVKPNPKRLDSGIESAIAETFKYSTKPGDLFGSGSEADKTWLVELTSQLHKTRAIALGGVLKKYLSESEPEELLTEEGSDELLEEATRLCFGWREEVSRYVKTFAD